MISSPQSADWQCDWRGDRVFWLILGIAAALSLLYNSAILLGFGPDETLHLNYVKLLLDARQLPVIENFDANHFRATGNAHGFHPPLYYAFLVPFYALFRHFPDATAWHLLRAVSSLFCLASLPLLYQVALKAADNRIVARIAVATVAFSPIFGMTAGIINNDAAAFFSTSLFLYLLCVRFAARRDLGSAVILGVVLGLGALCKVTVLLCGGAALLAALWARREWKSASSWKAALVTLGLGVLLVSPWHLRSFKLYGSWTPLPHAATWFHPPLHGLELVLHPDFPMLLARCNSAMFATLWSQRDWLLQRQTRPIGDYETPQLFIYFVLAACCAFAALGHLKEFRKPKTEISLEARTARAASYGAFALTWLTVLQVALTFHQGWSEGGRYLLPAFGGFALFVAIGFSKMLPDSRALKCFGAIWLGGLLSLNLVALYWLLTFLNPTYGPK